MADLVHANIVQQLDVALLGTPMVQVIDLLSGGLTSSPMIAMPAQPLSKSLHIDFPSTSSNISSDSGINLHQSKTCNCFNISYAAGQGTNSS